MLTFLKKILDSLCAARKSYDEGPIIVRIERQKVADLLTYRSSKLTQWYVIQVWGYTADSAKRNLEQRMQEARLETSVLRVMAPIALNPEPSPQFYMLDFTPHPGFLLVEMEGEITDEGQRLILRSSCVQRFVTPGELPSIIEHFGINPLSLIPLDDCIEQS